MIESSAECFEEFPFQVIRTQGAAVASLSSLPLNLRLRSICFSGTAASVLFKIRLVIICWTAHKDFAATTSLAASWVHTASLGAFSWSGG